MSAQLPTCQLLERYYGQAARLWPVAPPEDTWLLTHSTAMVSDKVSLGFVHATEERVAKHLRAHLKALPGEDRKSQLILQQMLLDEERHGQEALEHGGGEFPRPVKDAMSLASQLMTRTTYWI